MANFVLAFLVLALPATVLATEFIDPEDGYFDLSDFLDRPYGFIPVVSPITEPAVGYGAAAALVFVKKVPTEEGQPPIRPNVGAVGALATENGTKGGFAGYSGTLMKGKLRTLAALAKADINLEFYGLDSGDRPGENGINYKVKTTGGLVGASYQIGQSGWWVGARYVYAAVDTSLRYDTQTPADFTPPELELDLAAITPRLTLDTRNNMFTPTRGSYLDLTVPLFRSTWGSDRDFTKASLTGMWYHPVKETLFFGIRGTASTSSDGTPFYLRPAITLRGVEAIKYQGDDTAEIETELRWQFKPRFSLVGFVGAGSARKEALGRKEKKTVYSGGGGFRYLIARRYGINMGLDIGFGPDSPILYVIFGSAWNRE